MTISGFGSSLWCRDRSGRYEVKGKEGRVSSFLLGPSVNHLHLIRHGMNKMAGEEGTSKEPFWRGLGNLSSTCLTHTRPRKFLPLYPGPSFVFLSSLLCWWHNHPPASPAPFLFVPYPPLFSVVVLSVGVSRWELTRNIIKEYEEATPYDKRSLGHPPTRAHGILHFLQPGRPAKSLPSGGEIIPLMTTTTPICQLDCACPCIFYLTWSIPGLFCPDNWHRPISK